MVLLLDFFSDELPASLKIIKTVFKNKQGAMRSKYKIKTLKSTSKSDSAFPVNMTVVFLQPRS